MKKLILVLATISLISCTKDVSKSGEAEIIGFTVEATENFIPLLANIDSVNRQVQVFTTSELGDENFPVVLFPEIQLSDGAGISPESGTIISFNGIEDRAVYTVVSEDDETSTQWFVTLRDNQIPNAGFENWHEKTGANGVAFSDPGKYAETTVWATANMGTSIYGAYGTTAIIESENTLAQIQTLNTGAVPIASGTLFLGRFDINGAIENPTNPSAATKFGIPFYLRPSAIKFSYTYQSGDQLIQATLKDPEDIFGGFDIEEVAGDDKFSVEAKLEKRAGDIITVIGETSIISDENIGGLTELTLTINYNSEETPTHFYIVFASSADGEIYRGAVGSKLVVDNLELIYE